MYRSLLQTLTETDIYNLLRSESRPLSSSGFLQEAATGTSEEIQPWKQQNGMNFLCSNCIVGFLLMFCRISYWSLSLWASQPKQTPCRLTPRMSGRIIRQPWTRFPLQRCSVKALSRKAVTVYTPPLLKLVIFCVTYWRKDDKIPLSCLKYHRRLPHYSGDWQLQLPSAARRAGSVDRSLSHWWYCMVWWCRCYSISNLWLSLFFLQQNLFWCFFYVTHRAVIALHWKL